MLSICSSSSFSSTMKNGFIHMKQMNGQKSLSMSLSFFTGKRSHSSFHHKHQCKLSFQKNANAFNKGRGAMFMWGESDSKNAFSTSWYDDDNDLPRSSNSGTRRTQSRESERSRDNGDEQRNFRQSRNSNKGSGWDDFAADGSDDSSYEPYEYQRKGPSREGGERGGGQSGRGRNDRPRRNSNGRNQEWDSSRERQNFKRKDHRDRKTINAEIAERKVNMRALEKAGYEHLYGIAPVLNALKVEKRDMEPEEDAADTGRKPEAQFTPYLFVQNNIQDSRGGKSGDKAKAVKEILRLVEDANVPVAYADKGILNALSNNRPHQGFVLRSRSLDFTPLSKIPHPDEDENAPLLWLVLDEVVDPQNFGALLRSAYFLGNTSSIGVLVCAKNSSPASPTVSAASAGALELMTIHSTPNLPRILNSATEDGWRVLGAAAEALTVDSPADGSGGIIPCTDLMNLELEKNEPTILVLGSEGHGLRNLVARACTEFVRIPSGEHMGLSQGGDDTVAGVDSLNVSVTGGILLWTLVKGILK